MERVGQVFCTSPSIADENRYAYRFLERENGCESEEDSAIDAWEAFLRELDVEGHEMIEKFLSKVEENHHVPFERVLRETWHHFRGKKVARGRGGEREGDGGFVMRQRGVGLEGEELRNERFKVKTMNVAGSGVVEEGERK